MDIIAEIVSALATEEPVVLATIVSSSGSTPLPPGAMMLFKQAGRSVVGTVGGGSLELHVTAAARQIFEGKKRFFIFPFELNESTAEEGMICGGNVDVLVEQVGSGDLPTFSKLQGLLGAGRDCTLLRAVDQTKSALNYAVLEGPSDASAQNSPVIGFLQEFQIPGGRFMQTLERSHRGALVERLKGVDGELIFTPLAGVQPLIIFGGGHIGRSLCRIAAIAGFKVTVVDDRKEYTDKSRFPDAARIIAEKFVDAFEHLEVHSSASIVIVTRGHEFDREVLRKALTTSARYIGMIGSRKKVAATFTRLHEAGVPLSTLMRVRAPVGLELGAVSAEEIAVGIVAELIRVRRGFDATSEPMSKRMSEWFRHAT